MVEFLGGVRQAPVKKATRHAFAYKLTLHDIHKEKEENSTSPPLLKSVII